MITSYVSSPSSITILSRWNIVVSCLLELSWLIAFFLFGIVLNLLLLLLLNLLPSCYLLSTLDLLPSEWSKSFLLMMLVLSVFTLLVLWHKNIIINGESFNKTQLNNTLFYHNSLIMSKSFRQIGQLKQAGNTMNSTQTMPAHRRNKSI